MREENKKSSDFPEDVSSDSLQDQESKAAKSDSEPQKTGDETSNMHSEPSASKNEPDLQDSDSKLPKRGSESSLKTAQDADQTIKKEENRFEVHKEEEADQDELFRSGLITLTEADFPKEREKPSQAQKKRNILKTPGFYILIILAVISVLVLAAMNRLGLFEPSVTLAAAGIGVFAILLGIWLFYLAGKRVYRIAGFLMALILALCGGFFMNTVHAVSENLKMICSDDPQIINSVGIYAYKQAPVASLESLNGKSVGLLSKKNAADNARVLSELESTSVKVVPKFFDNYEEMLRALKGQAIRAVVLNEADTETAGELSPQQSVSDSLSLIKSFSVETGLSNEPKAVDVKTTPFNILVSGSYDSLDKQDYRSSLNLLLSVNPDSKEILITNLPRDYQIGYACDPQLECDGGYDDKLSASSYHSIEALKSTVESLLDVTVNYTIRVDLNDFFSFIDKLGKITVNNKEEYVSGSYTFAKGELEMDAATAKKYAGDQDEFSALDRRYAENELDVFMAVLNELHMNNLSGLKDFSKMLDSCARTNMSYEELIQIVSLFYLHRYPWSEYLYTLEGNDAIEYSQFLCTDAYMIKPDPASLSAAREDVQAVMNGQKPAAAILQNPEQKEGVSDEAPESKPASESNAA